MTIALLLNWISSLALILGDRGLLLLVRHLRRHPC
jgi:hypothetical protein